MSASPIILALVAVVLVFLWMGRGRSPTSSVRDYFLGNRQLRQKHLIVLMISTSFSVNGILYQTWLGYSIGWAAILIQVIWCLGFIWMAKKATKIRTLLDRGTLHGVIASVHGQGAGTMAAIASIGGFFLLIGWEFMCATSLLSAAAPNSTGFIFLGAVSLAAVGAIYSAIGGLRSNARANEYQNIIAALGITVIIGVLLWWGHQGTIGLITTPGIWESPAKLLAGLGINGLIANMAFSLFWQFCDMSNWQAMSALGSDREKLSKGLTWTALGVFILPGVVGTVLGISVSGVEGLTDSTILTGILTLVATHSGILAFLLSVALFCAFLSTLDGYFLASTQSLVWDVLKRRDITDLLSSSYQGKEEEERKILGISRGLVFLVAGLSVAITLILHFGFKIGLFSLVYIVTVAQLSLTGAVFSAISEKRSLNGFASIASGLVVGFASLAIGLGGGHTWALELSGVFSIIASFAGLWLPKRRSHAPSEL